MARMAAGGGPTQAMPAASTASAKLGVLGEEAEARMDGVGAAAVAARDDGLDVEEVDGVAAVGRRLDRHDAEPVGSSPDPARDLAAVGDEQPADRPNGRGLVATVVRRCLRVARSRGPGARLFERV